MKRLRVILSAALAAALLAACSRPTAPEKVRVATDPTFPPFEVLDEGRRQLVGFDLDLMKAIAARANLDVEFVSASLPAVVQGVAACEYDAGISAIAVTPERQQQVAFSKPYFTNGQVLVVKRGNLTLTGPGQLSGVTVGVQARSAGAAALAPVSGVRLKTYRSPDSAFEDLINGLIDAVVADEPLAANYVAIRANNLQLVGAPLSAEDYAIAVCPQHAALAQKIDAGLAAARADGTLEKLKQQWVLTLNP